MLSKLDEQALQLTETARELILDSSAPNSKRAYHADIKLFVEWGGDIPAEPETISNYAAHMYALLKPDGSPRYAASTIMRHMSSLSKAHETLNLVSPVKHPLVRATLKGIRVKRGMSPVQKQALSTAQLLEGISLLDDSLLSLRNKAVLLLGFASAMRRAELAAINKEDLHLTREGYRIEIPRSKTNQEGKPESVSVCYGENEHSCPVRATEAYIKKAGIKSGALFRGVTKHGTIYETALRPKTINRIVKSLAKSIGLEPANYGGHSLRAGHVTQADENGASSSSMRKQGRWSDDKMPNLYTRVRKGFENNSSAMLGL